ncbi:hypothetical protein KV205_11865 [Streptomyces sp. SKN60]|uniref:hypothetical protein n=1 Tax=Streptomyces sp. SKN60 TaxID=2855506 RepID=UPI0022485D04|nr:hypothetical protein [Streptomyces sp. SKN60]MCX2181222.1 hypothetical protein [Streptomyces sp. SKN60]
MGTAVLLAAAPAGRGRAIDAASVLPALAAVPAAVLAGAHMATVVELADPLDPQTVLTRLRSAAATPGPLALYLAGQVQLDRRQRLPHLALARSTPTTLRYTGLPWHWLATELAPRRPGTTHVVADLSIDPELWHRLTTDPTALGLGPATPLYARLTPFPRRGPLTTPDYLRHFASRWRAGAVLPLPALHAEAAAAAATTAPQLESILLAPPAPVSSAPAPAPVPVPVPGPGPVPAPVPVPVRAPALVESPPTRRLVRPGGDPPSSAAEVPQTRDASTAEPVAPVPDQPASPSGAPEDPHPAILAAAMAGRHGEAAAVAAAWESDALRRYGPRSGEALHWVEVRADLARLAGEPARSCELWIAAAQARLGLRQGPDEPDVEGAVDRAHHQWEQIADPARARALGPALVELRRTVPGRRAGALAALQRRLGG